MQETINIHEAKTHLSAIIHRCLEGDEIIIAKSNRPLVKLVPLQARKKRKLGFLKGQVSDSFFEPLSETELKDWESS